MDVPADRGDGHRPTPSPPPMLVRKTPRVLAVDGDAAHLEALEKLLRRCSYEATTCSHLSMAMEMLRANRGKFDVVLTDVFGAGLAGLEFLESVRSEMGLPVVVMLMDGKIDPGVATAAAMKKKACGYMTKPSSIEELKSTLQRIVECKPRVSLNSSSSPSSPTTAATISTLKRMKLEGTTVNHDEVEHVLPETNVKKPRVVWTEELHDIFVAAVDKLQQYAVPKKILEEMNVSGLSRANVASHLQKYRMGLKQAQEKKKIQQPSASTLLQRTMLPPHVQAPLLPNWHMQQQMRSGQQVIHGPFDPRCNNLTSDHGHHFRAMPTSATALQHRFNGPLVQTHRQRIFLPPQVRMVHPSAAYLCNNGGLPEASYGSPVGNPNLNNGQMVQNNGQMVIGDHMGFGGDMQNHSPNWSQMQPSELANMSQEYLSPEAYGRDQMKESYIVQQQISIRTQVGHECVTEPIASSSNSDDTNQELTHNLLELENDSDSPSWEFGSPNNFD